MGKLLEERLSGEYPGLLRIIHAFENKVIEVEFLPNYSNEIGLRFRKQYFDAAAENVLLKDYFRASGYLDYEPSFSENSALADYSWVQLIRDALSKSILLPGNGLGSNAG